MSGEIKDIQESATRRDNLSCAQASPGNCTMDTAQMSSDVVPSFFPETKERQNELLTSRKLTIAL